jgi:hypothetical protein
MISPTGRYLQDIQAAQAIAGYLTAVGIKVNGPATADSAAYQGMVSAPPATSTTELFIWSFAPDFPHASQQLGRLLITNSIPPKSGINYSHYSNAQVDTLIGEGRHRRPGLGAGRHRLLLGAEVDLGGRTLHLPLGSSSADDPLREGQGSHGRPECHRQHRVRRTALES